jgi:hypothetical protein
MLFNLLIIALLLVLLVLVLGFITLMIGNNPKRSNTLMKVRVGLQFLIILFLFIVFMFYNGVD